MLRELVKHSTGDFGYQRSRWSTELLVIKINYITGCQLHCRNRSLLVAISRACVAQDCASLRIRDTHKDEKMAAIHKALDESGKDH